MLAVTELELIFLYTSCGISLEFAVWLYVRMLRDHPADRRVDVDVISSVPAGAHHPVTKLKLHMYGHVCNISVSASAHYPVTKQK